MHMILRVLAAAFVFVAWANADAQALRAYEMKSIALYQPDDVLTSRVGHDAVPLAGYIEAINAVATDEFGRAERGRGSSGAIVIAVKPSGASRMWLVLGENELPEGLAERLKSRVERIGPMSVSGGPIAFALVFDAWGGGVPIATSDQPAPYPDEWRVATDGEPLVVPDGILDVIWP